MGQGPSQASGNEPMESTAAAAALCTHPDGFELLTDESERLSCGALTNFSIFDNDPSAEQDKARLQKRLKAYGNGQDSLSVQERRAIGALVGLCVGDALGAPLEFTDVRYGTTDLREFGQQDIWDGQAGDYNRFRLKPGQWTDDTSMALCLADSLLKQKGFNPRDLRQRFMCWWIFGYNNAFGADEMRKSLGSVGLGGNISKSLAEFQSSDSEYTTAGNLHTSGNGSIMRLAPVPIFYCHNPAQALQVAWSQSKTTHQGTEAAECARLLTHIIVRAINHPSKSAVEVARDVLGDVCGAEGDVERFSSELYSIRCLAESKTEQHRVNCDQSDSGGGEGDSDDELTGNVERNWDWKSPEFRYSPSRAEAQPGYVGSYCMDAMAMALHCVANTSSARECLLYCANIRGDADTVCAVAGQIAGAIYGVAPSSNKGAVEKEEEKQEEKEEESKGIPLEWLLAVQRWDNQGEIALRAWRLFHAEPGPGTVHPDAPGQQRKCKPTKRKQRLEDVDDEENNDNDDTFTNDRDSTTGTKAKRKRKRRPSMSEIKRKRPTARNKFCDSK